MANQLNRMDVCRNFLRHSEKKNVCNESLRIVFIIVHSNGINKNRMYAIV